MLFLEILIPLIRLWSECVVDFELIDDWSAAKRMPTLILLLAPFIFLSTPARETAPPTRVFPAPVGLIMIATLPDGIAIAADGASANADGTISQAQKLFAVGNKGVVAVAGAVSIQDPVTRPVREEVNIARITAAWLDAHPDATLDVANKEINGAVAQATTKYFSTRDPGSATARYKFALVFAGLINGKPVVNVTRYYTPVSKGKAMRAERLTDETRAGQIWVFGQSRVEQALTAGSLSSLAKFAAEASIKKLRSARSTDLTLQDYVNAFDTVLRATESEQAKKIVGKLAVAPPNKLATISTDGFRWSKAN